MRTFGKFIGPLSPEKAQSASTSVPEPQGVPAVELGGRFSGRWAGKAWRGKTWCSRAGQVCPHAVIFALTFFAPRWVD